MDDFLASKPVESKAVRLIDRIIQINYNANFSMYGWTSN
jgi:hypothetical protein